MPQVVETEIVNSCPFEQIIEASFQPSPLPDRSTLKRKHPEIVLGDRKPPVIIRGIPKRPATPMRVLRAWGHTASFHPSALPAPRSIPPHT